MIRSFGKLASSAPIFDGLSHRVLTVFGTLLLGGAFTYFVLNPTVGIDDANITQVYGQAFAERFEFTYFAGGERVEGSTSLLWTLINALAFLLPGSGEVWITAACIALTGYTLSNCWWIGKETFDWDHPLSKTSYSLLFCGAFLMVPSFFAWSVWSLMDITVWLALLSAMLVFTVDQLNAESAAMTRNRVVLFASCFALLTITRPEGIAISTGVLGYLVLHAHLSKQDRTRNQYLWALGATLGLFGAVTLWRFYYFGVPLPNTYYAKVTQGTLDQMIAGSAYLLKFIQSDFNALLLLFSGIGVVITLNSRSRLWTIFFEPKALLCLFLFGLFALYVAIGGDHFASYRFYQPAFLVIIPLAAGSAASLLSRAKIERRQALVRATIASTVICASFGLISFSEYGGRLDHEFRIAESGRDLGRRLNQMSPGTSIAVISAGGSAVTYKQGPIYDLMGLNWSEMAHANDDTPSAFTNFGNFVEPVFWKTRPDIVAPRLLPSCQFVDRYPTKFWSDALKGMLQSDRFHSEYELICERSIALFARRDIADRARRDLTGSQSVMNAL